MIAHLRCCVLPLAAILLAAAGVQAQETVVCPVEQVCVEPSIWFHADALLTSRGGIHGQTRTIIAGPDATSFNDLGGFDEHSGYRLQGAVRVGNWIFEGAYSDWGGWDSSLVREIDGVAFNDVTGDWVGRNFINGSTFFTPISNAANLTVPVRTVDDQSGMGPSASFTTDAPPVATAYYQSHFHMAEANVKGANFFFAGFGGGLRLGVGYVHAGLSELAQVGLSGTFRAVSNVGGPTVSLPDAALTASAGGNLQLLSGGATGFSDGTDGTGIPSELIFTQQTSTHNELNGVQLVLDGTLVRWARLDIGGKLQAGIFDNSAWGTIVETYGETNRDQSVYGRSFQNSQDQVAFLGGVGLNLGYHLTECLTARCGYEVLFLSGLALAQDQVDGINGRFYEVQTGASAVIHAAHLGLEVAF